MISLKRLTKFTRCMQIQVKDVSNKSERRWSWTTQVFFHSSEKTGIGLFRLPKERKIRNNEVIILKYIQTKGVETIFLLNSIQYYLLLSGKSKQTWLSFIRKLVTNTLPCLTFVNFSDYPWNFHGCVISIISLI